MPSPWEAMQERRAQEIRESLEEKQRCLNAPYQLVQISPQRFLVIKLCSWSGLYFNVQHLAKYSVVFGPAKHDACLNYIADNARRTNEEG